MRATFRLFSRAAAVCALSLSGLALVTFGPPSVDGAAASNASKLLRRPPL